MPRRNYDIGDFCSEVHPDDGIPYERHKPKTKDEYRKRRFLKQIAIAVDNVLFSGRTRTVPTQVHLALVEELSGSSCVLLVFGYAGDPANELEVLLLLEQLVGAFRNEVARLVNRKRTPQLKVSVIPEGGIRL